MIGLNIIQYCKKWFVWILYSTVNFLLGRHLENSENWTAIRTVDLVNFFCYDPSFCKIAFCQWEFSRNYILKLNFSFFFLFKLKMLITEVDIKIRQIIHTALQDRIKKLQLFVKKYINLGIKTEPITVEVDAMVLYMFGFYHRIINDRIENYGAYIGFISK